MGSSIREKKSVLQLWKSKLFPTDAEAARKTAQEAAAAKTKAEATIATESKAKVEAAAMAEAKAKAAAAQRKLKQERNVLRRRYLRP